MKSDDETRAIIRRFLIMGSVSAILHGIIAALLFLGTSRADEKKVYRVEIRRLRPVTEQAGIIESAAPPEPKELREIRREPEKPAVIDLPRSSTPIPLETVELLEEAVKNAEIVETPVPPAEDVTITPGGGMGSGADEKTGGGNSLLATGTGSGFGGALSGEGWGGGSGSPGSGGGTGGGYGSGSGNSRGREGVGGEKTGVYFAGMPGIVPPGYVRTSQPNYPEASRKRGEEGDVLLKVEVLTNGRVGQAEIDESSGFTLLDEAALRTVRNWRFKPALKGREEVACWVNIPIRFKLR
jgi:TonB family protein